MNEQDPQQGFDLVEKFPPFQSEVQHMMLRDDKLTGSSSCPCSIMASPSMQTMWFS